MRDRAGASRPGALVCCACCVLCASTDDCALGDTANKCVRAVDTCSALSLSQLCVSAFVYDVVMTGGWVSSRIIEKVTGAASLFHLSLTVYFSTHSARRSYLTSVCSIPSSFGTCPSSLTRKIVCDAITR